MCKDAEIAFLNNIVKDVPSEVLSYTFLTKKINLHEIFNKKVINCFSMGFNCKYIKKLTYLKI